MAPQEDVGWGQFNSGIDNQISIAECEYFWNLKLMNFELITSTKTV